MPHILGGASKNPCAARLSRLPPRSRRAGLQWWIANVEGRNTVMNNRGKGVTKRTPLIQHILIGLGLLAFMASSAQAQTATASFGPSNPFYAPSTLPFHAPPFDKIKDSDYQPAIDAGIAQQLVEINAIADNPAAPTFDNTVVQIEKAGLLLERVNEVFNCVTEANTRPRAAGCRAAWPGRSPRRPSRARRCCRGSGARSGLPPRSPSAPACG